MRVLILTVLFCTVLGTGLSHPQQEEDYLNLSLEDLLGLTIVSATRSEAKLSESPIPISVITANDIAKSGLTSIPDILARLSEVDVLRIGRSQTEVSIRGKGINFNRRLLVLIDGRTEYNDLFGVTLWDAFSISVNDIDRIEVVRGPASALFGANAFSGVINIITKSVDTTTSEVKLTMGTRNATTSQFRYVGGAGPLAFKVTAGTDEADSFESDVPFEGFNGFETRMSLNPDDESFSKKKATLLLQYKPQDAWTFKLSAGLSDGEQELFPQPGLPRADWDVKTSNMQFSADYQVSEKGTWELNVYQNRFDYRTALVPDANALLELDFEDGRFFFPALNEPRDFASRVDTTNVALQYVGNLQEGNFKYVIGLESRSIDNEGLDGNDSGLVMDSNKDIDSLFGNMTWKFARDKWLVGLGFRHEDDSMTGGDYGYTGALSYFLNDKHSLRLTSRRAFRAPSLFELFSDVLINVPAQNHSVRFLGNTTLENEVIESVDLTYSGRFGSKIQLTLELYEETYESLIGNPDSGLLEDIEFDDITQQFTTTTTFRNLADAESRGFQATMVYQHSEELFISGGLAYADPEGLNDLSGETFYTPEQKFNLAISWRPMLGLQVMLEDQYVGKTDEAELMEGATFTRENQDAYNLVNFNVSYTFQKLQKLTVSLTATNLLDDNFVSYHEFDPVLNGVGEGFGREIYGGLQWRFK